MSQIKLIILLFIIGIASDLWSIEIDDNLLGAIAKVESNCQGDAVGDDGKSLGEFQIKCSTAKQMGMKGKCNKLLRPKIAKIIAKKYLIYLRNELDGDIVKAIDAYNRGLSNVKKCNHPIGFHKYPLKVLKNLQENNICII